ncbi:hypothetical protein HDU87_005519 [Geranomyces variabilis]|uniref:TPR-like protein n=1 Tax=Geranomyces variabilis TaxID=109894 RepID=A0AAD5XLR4_9FUNG|nr:hypothetical protein HDU87_005519 [Geranomyces variabilis]
MAAQTVDEKLQTGKAEKDKGNAAFKAGQIPEALRAYHTATLYLTGLDNAAMAAFVPQNPLAETIKAEIKDTLKACYSNMSACYLKQSRPEKCIELTAKVLALDPNNAKALFRRGQANIALENEDAAYADLLKAAELAPQDKGIRDALASAHAMVKERAAKSDAVFKGKLL